MRTEARERHADPSSVWRQAFIYSDGFGREIQTKIPAEPASGSDSPRWVGTGRTIYNNKGWAVKRYEPFFSDTSDFEDEAALAQNAAVAVLHYDPPGRLVRVDYPDGTYDRTELGPWRNVFHDRNETVLESDWLQAREALPSGNPDRRAADLTKAHANTPRVEQLDSAGRTVAVSEDNGASGVEQHRALAGVDALFHK